MSQFAVCSVKGAPGATTLALAMTCALAHSRGDAALVEADPAGGDLAALLGLPIEPGMTSLAAASRHHSASPDLRAHAQVLPAGGWALLGSTDPTQAGPTVATLASRLLHAVDEEARDAVIDGGRWTPASPITPLLREVTATVICLTSSVPAIEAVRVRASDLWESTGGRVGLVVIGPDRYGAEEIEACTGMPVVGAVPWDERAYSGLFGAAKTRVERSSLVRAARSIVDRLDAIGEATPSATRQPRISISPNGDSA